MKPWSGKVQCHGHANITRDADRAVEGGYGFLGIRQLDRDVIWLPSSYTTFDAFVRKLWKYGAGQATGIAECITDGMDCTAAARAHVQPLIW